VSRRARAARWVRLAGLTLVIATGYVLIVIATQLERALEEFRDRTEGPRP
jgi:hypothetical protein